MSRSALALTLFAVAPCSSFVAGCDPDAEAGGGQELATSTGSTSAGTTATPDGPTATTEAAEISRGGSAGPITLHFDWPSGARGRCETSRTVERTGLGQSGRSSARFRVAVTRRGSETTLRTSELTLRTPPGGPGETLNGVLVAATFLPSARFTTDLDALSLLEPDRTGAALREAVEAATSPELRALPAFQGMAPMLLGDPEMLRRQAESLIRPLTLLDELRVERGQLVASRDERTTGAGEAAQQSTMTTLLGTGACFEGDLEEGCVSLEITAHYGAEALAGAAGPATIRSIDGTLRLVIEPTTLLPHRMEAEKETALVAPGPMGETQEMTETESLRWIFRWERRTIRD
jgi:hypothetical protein